MGKVGRPVGSRKFTAQVFIDAIPGSGGIISTIAKRVGCAWHTAKKYCAEYATVAKAYQDECESITDLAESTVLKSIQAGDVTTAKWYLTMKAKGRGYSQKYEIDAMIRNLDLTKLTDNQLNRLSAGEDLFDVLTASDTG